jgi:hypothetical protein
LILIDVGALLLLEDILQDDVVEANARGVYFLGAGEEGLLA